VRAVAVIVQQEKARSCLFKRPKDVARGAQLRENIIRNAHHHRVHFGGDFGGGGVRFRFGLVSFGGKLGMGTSKASL
jgi:hypothetical protein